MKELSWWILKHESLREKKRDCERATAVIRETNRWLKRGLRVFQGS